MTVVYSRFYRGLQKNLYWMRTVTENMTNPWMDMAQRFFPTISQLSGSSKRSSPGEEKMEKKWVRKQIKYKSIDTERGK